MVRELNAGAAEEESGELTKSLRAGQIDKERAPGIVPDESHGFAEKHVGTIAFEFTGLSIGRVGIIIIVIAPII